MARGKDFTTTELNQIRSYLKDGLTYAEIGELIGRDKKAIANVTFRYGLRKFEPTQTETPKEWKSDMVKQLIEKTNTPMDTTEPPVVCKDKTLSDFNPREIIKHLYNLGYRIEDNKLICIVRQVVNIKDIINA